MRYDLAVHVKYKFMCVCAGGVRRRAHALPGAVRAGDGDGGAARARAARRPPRRALAVRARHARPAPGTTCF